MEGDPSKVYVTQDEYEKSLRFESYFNEDDNNNHHDSSSSQYRAFSNELARMETERRTDNRNTNNFRRPINPPQVLQRERRNEDQPTHSSFYKKMKI